MTGSVKLNSAGGGSVSIVTPSTASNLTLTLPAATSTLIDTTSTQTLTNKTLTAAGSNTVEATSGPTSTQLAGQRNKIINGAMMIDQRNAGASVTPGSNFSYLLDRWLVYNSVSSKFSAQQNAGSVTPPSGFSKYLGITSLSAYSTASNDYFLLGQKIEGFNCADLVWGTASAAPITLSFWVRSSLTGNFGGAIQNQAQARSYPFIYAINAANTWEYKTITIPGDTSGTWAADNNAGLCLFLGLGVGTTYSGTAGAWAGTNYVSATGATSVVGTNGATFYITGVQLEKGSVATPFENRLYGAELALCQRYYQKMASLLVAGYVGTAAGTYYSGSTSFLVEMRTAPTLSLSNFVNSNSGNATASGVSARCFRFFAANTAAGSAYSLFDMETTGAEL